MQKSVNEEEIKGVVNTTFAYQFTWHCKFVGKCSICHLCPWFNLSLHHISLFLHLILSSTSLRALQNFHPVHSEILFSQRFYCRPLLLPPCTVPCKIVLASPDDLDTCPNHFNLRFFTVVKISSWGPMACLILSLTASLVMWSLYEMPSSFLKHLISVACNFFRCPLSMSRFRRRTIVPR